MNNEKFNYILSLEPLNKNLLEVTTTKEINEKEDNVTNTTSSILIEEYNYERLIEFSVPDIDTSFKTYTDYRCITDKTSKQYEIRNQCYTDDDGMRRLISNNDYIIALGTYYTNQAGERFKVTLSTGVEFYATVGDIKKNKDTDESNRYVQENGNLIEFHIDEEVIPKMITKLGDVSYLEQFKGQVIKVEKVIEK